MPTTEERLTRLETKVDDISTRINDMEKFRRQIEGEILQRVDELKHEIDGIRRSYERFLYKFFLGFLIPIIGIILTLITIVIRIDGFRLSSYLSISLGFVGVILIAVLIFKMHVLANS